MFGRWFVVVLCCWSCLFATAEAQTKPKKLTAEQATKMSRTAEQHYKLQEYEQALELFKELYRQTNEATLLFNIGQCYRQLGQFEKALKSYQSFLQENPTSPLAPNAQQRITEVEAAIQVEIAKTQPATAPIVPDPPKEIKKETSPKEPGPGRPLYRKAIITGALSAAAAGGSLIAFSRERTLIEQIEQDQGGSSLDDVKRSRQLAFLSIGLGATADVLFLVSVLYVGVGVKKNREALQVSISPTGATLSLRF
jgi:tetratricopeptide (TPR) repeat protein